jgi:hypothetical protein
MYRLEEIPDETRAALRQLYADPDPGRWYWDAGMWRFEISMRDATEDIDAGYVAIAPLKYGETLEPLEPNELPSINHVAWLISFVGPVDISFPVYGLISKSKYELDKLLKEPTAEILWEDISQVE